MSRTPRSRIGRPLVVLLVAAGLLSALTAGLPGMPSASADTVGNLVVTRASTSHQSNVAPGTPLTGLADGDIITIAVTATGTGTAPANNIIYGMDARLCRAGLNINFSSQFASSNGNCIDAPLTPASSSFVERAFAAPNTSGSLPFIVGTGTETAHVGSGDPITCDSTHPCALWLRQAVPTGIIASGNAFVHFDLQYAGAPTAPAAPTAVMATAGNGQATVSWTAPPTATPPVTGYTVTSSPGGKTCTTAGATTCAVTGLTNGTPYTFTVKATNTVGDSAASAASSAVTPQAPAAPGAPTNVSGIAGNGSVAVSWTAPSSIGTSAITSYTVTSSPGAKTCGTSGATTCTVTGLTNATAYTFTVTATNAVGTGPASAASAPVTPTAPPITFTDVPPGAPFYDDIMWMVGEGITTGYVEGDFRPTVGTSRQGIAAFLYRFAGSPNGENPTCTSAPFDDVPIDHPFCGEITWMVGEGITTGYSDNTFRPTAPMSRQAMASFLYRFADSPNGDDPTCTAAAFTDVPASHMFCGEIKWLSDEGITLGYDDGSFKPTVIVSRQAVSAYLHRMATL